MKQSILATAVVGALALGAAGQASASVYASSALSIEDLSILITEDGTTPSTGVSISTFEFTATNTASLNNVSALPQSLTCGGLPGAGNNTCGTSPVLDPDAANATGGTVSRNNNDFSLFGPGTNTYANSDSVVSSAELVNLGFPTSTSQIAEAEIQGTGFGRSNAELTSNTGFTFTFDISGDSTNQLKLGFLATSYMRAYIDTVGFINGSAQSNMNVSFTLAHLDDVGNTIGSVGWRPSAGCTVQSTLVGVTCLVDDADFNLNQNLLVTANPGNSLFSEADGVFGLTVSGLTNGTWGLALNALTSVSVRQAVPEPASMALLGLGVVGLGFANRRRGRVHRG